MRIDEFLGKLSVLKDDYLAANGNTPASVSDLRDEIELWIERELDDEFDDFDDDDDDIDLWDSDLDDSDLDDSSY